MNGHCALREDTPCVSISSTYQGAAQQHMDPASAPPNSMVTIMIKNAEWLSDLTQIRTSLWTPGGKLPIAPCIYVDARAPSRAAPAGRCREWVARRPVARPRARWPSGERTGDCARAGQSVQLFPHFRLNIIKTLKEYAGDDHIMAYPDCEADSKQYQPHARTRGHLAPEDEHAGREARLELYGLARAEQPHVAAAAAAAAVAAVAIVASAMCRRCVLPLPRACEEPCARARGMRAHCTDALERQAPREGRMELALRCTLLEARPLSEARLEESHLAPLRRQERREERRQALAPDGGVAEQLCRGREVAHLPPPPTSHCRRIGHPHAALGEPHGVRLAR